MNSFSFVFSACAIWRIAVPGGFRSRHQAFGSEVAPWREYREGLAYMRSVPLLMGIAMTSVGWAMGGGAAQILFALFGEQVFHRGASGIGSIWGFAGIGLLAGGAVVSRRTLAPRAGVDAEANERSVDVEIARLRRKIDGGSHCLQTVRGQGYRLIVDGEGNNTFEHRAPP